MEYINEDPMEGEDQEMYFLNVYNGCVKSSKEWIKELDYDSYTELTYDEILIPVTKQGNEWVDY